MSMEFIKELPTPEQILEEYPLPDECKKTKEERDRQIADILTAHIQCMKKGSEIDIVADSSGAGITQLIRLADKQVSAAGVRGLRNYRAWKTIEIVVCSFDFYHFDFHEFRRYFTLHGISNKNLDLRILQPAGYTDCDAAGCIDLRKILIAERK